MTATKQLILVRVENRLMMVLWWLWTLPFLVHLTCCVASVMPGKMRLSVSSSTDEKTSASLRVVAFTVGSGRVDLWCDLLSTANRVWAGFMCWLFSLFWGNRVVLLTGESRLTILFRCKFYFWINSERLVLLIIIMVLICITWAQLYRNGITVIALTTMTCISCPTVIVGLFLAYSTWGWVP